jgi:hypothetical protein
VRKFWQTNPLLSEYPLWLQGGGKGAGQVNSNAQSFSGLFFLAVGLGMIEGEQAMQTLYCRLNLLRISSMYSPL